MNDFKVTDEDGFLSVEEAQSTHEETVKINQERSHECEVMVAEQKEHTLRFATLTVRSTFVQRSCAVHDRLHWVLAQQCVEWPEARGNS